MASKSNALALNFLAVGSHGPPNVTAGVISLEVVLRGTRTIVPWPVAHQINLLNASVPFLVLGRIHSNNSSKLLLVR
eukprot:scaffold5637_cov47-Attheya_sp.AAC.1